MKMLTKLALALGILGMMQACGGGETGAVTAKDSVLTELPEVNVWTERIAQSPMDTGLYAGRYRVLMELGKYDKAAADAKKLMELDTTQVRFYRMLANAYFEGNDSRQAIKVMQGAVARFDKDIYTRLALGEMHLVVQEYEQARIALDDVLKLEPYNTSAMYMLGQIAKEQGDTMAALMQFQKVVEQDAEHLDAYIQLGKLADKLNRPIALQYFDNALRIDSASLTALMSKAQYFHQRGEFDKALAIYDRAVNAHPLEAEVQYNMGLLFLERADLAGKNKAAADEFLEKARRHFENATKFDVVFGEAYYYLGLSYEKLGKLAEAQRHYENAVQMGEGLGLAQAALDRLKKG